MTSASDRKALIREYKESYRPMGAFRILNRTNGLMFVGSSVNLPAIFNRLRMELRANGYRKHPDLQKDWNACGEEAFEFEVLAELDAPEAPGVDVSDDLAALESLWLEELKPWGQRGYNRPPS
ncbi:MAG: GIY-YIG nuclease family protein [Acidobacteriota bacterium]|nr:GIY-YIG nuclease family protein [Acidobacteriota bacterium]